MILGQRIKSALAEPLLKDLVKVTAIKVAVYSRRMVKVRYSLQKFNFLCRWSAKENVWTDFKLTLGSVPEYLKMLMRFITGLVLNVRVTPRANIKNTNILVGINLTRTCVLDFSNF